MLLQMNKNPWSILGEGGGSGQLRGGDTSQVEGKETRRSAHAQFHGWIILQEERRGQERMDISKVEST